VGVVREGHGLVLMTELRRDIGQGFSVGQHLGGREVPEPVDVKVGDSGRDQEGWPAMLPHVFNRVRLAGLGIAEDIGVRWGQRRIAEAFPQYPV
jgi:hypothetical protein